MSVKELASQISRVMGVPERIELLPPRKEVLHAHCRHDLARKTFPNAYARPMGIAAGLARMADFVRSRPVPPVTECPSAIEIPDLLPPSWKARLRA
jgi:hypothetical protein